MKNSTLRMAVFFLLGTAGLWAQQGIGTNNPNASAALEIVSPDKGVLIPSISLTSTKTFAPITGTSSTTHNGMIIWNENATLTNGLTGIGFYFWENDPSTTNSGTWYRITTEEDGQVSGTVTNSTLRWDGSDFVETQTLLVSSTVATFTQDLYVLANQTVTGTLEVTGNATVTGSTVASGTLTANSTTTLKAALVDSRGEAGSAGQILSSTGTSTQWVDANFSVIATLTVTNNVTSTISLLILEPAADMTVTLADATTVSDGFEIKIRRNSGYTGTNDLISLAAAGGETIDGQTTKNLNVGYQSITLMKYGSGWVSVN